MTAGDARGPSEIIATTGTTRAPGDRLHDRTTPGQTQTHTEIQTDRRTDTEAELLVIMAVGLPDRHRHTEIQTDRAPGDHGLRTPGQTQTHTEIQTDRQTSRAPDDSLHGRTNSDTQRDTDRETEL